MATLVEAVGEVDVVVGVVAEVGEEVGVATSMDHSMPFTSIHSFIANFISISFLAVVVAEVGSWDKASPTSSMPRPLANK